MFDNQEASRPNVPSIPWVITCGLMCVGIVLYGASGAMGLSGSAAYQAGASLPTAAALAGLLHWMFGRKRAPFLGWIGFGLIYACMLWASTTSAERNKNELKAELADVTQTVKAMESNIKSGAPLPPQMNVGAATGTDGQKMGVALKTIMNRMLSLRADYERELQELGWSTAMQPQNLRSDKNFVKTKDILAKARPIVAKYRARTSELLVQARRDLEASDMAPDTKRSVLAGFDSALERGKAQSMATWDMEEEVVGDFDHLIGVLEHAKGWRVENGSFVFDRQTDLEQFNAVITKIQATAAKQQEMQASSLRRAQESLGKIGS